MNERMGRIRPPAFTIRRRGTTSLPSITERVYEAVSSAPLISVGIVRLRLFAFCQAA